MIDASFRFTGNEEFLYVKAGTAPTTATNPAQYTKVGFLLSNPFAGTSERVEVTDKDSTGAFSSSLAGRSSYTVDVEAHRKVAAGGDAGQNIIRDAWVNKTNVWWLITTGATGATLKHGVAAVTDYGETSTEGEFATTTATLAGQGAPTFGLVPT